MDHLLRQIAEATRMMELATAQIHDLKARIHDLEIENQRLRDNLAFRSTQYEEVAQVNDALQAHVANLELRIKTNRERIRRMEEGEL